MTLTEEQGGFDLAAARDAVKMCNINTTVWAHGCAKHLPGAIDLIELQTAEIERLRGFETAARDLNNDLTRIAGERDDLAAQIKELEGREEDLFTCYNCGKKVDDVETGPVLGEIHFDPGYPGGEYEPPEPAVAYFVCTDCLKTESKIEPDDSKKISHLRPYEVVAADLAGMLAKSWRITDERVEALWHAINVLKENDIMEEPEEHLWDEEVTVLQAMLTEAGQE